jgi:hypothetical protein
MSSIKTARMKSNVESSILRMLQPGPLTKPQMIQRLGITHTYVNTSIDRLLEQGKIRKVPNDSEASGKWAFERIE